MTHLAEIDAGDGRLVPTLADILPEDGELRALFIGKTPSPASVEAGHYFEGKMGKGLWKRLGDAGILRASPIVRSSNFASAFLASAERPARSRKVSLYVIR